MNKPKIKIPLNEHGQPIGPDATEFANFIGTLVRKHIPPKTIDWRDLDEEKKLVVWEDLQVLHLYYYNAAVWNLSVLLPSFPP
jgi:hypothetical protein